MKRNKTIALVLVVLLAAATLIGCGGKPLIYEALQVAVDPGDEVLLFTPAWVSYVEQIRLAEGREVLVDTLKTGLAPTRESVEAALVKATDWPPDLILLGQGLLQSEGLAALTRLTTALPGAQVLLVGSAADPILGEALAGGAHVLIPVPLRLEAVRKAVDQALGRG